MVLSTDAKMYYSKSFIQSGFVSGGLGCAFAGDGLVGASFGGDFWEGVAFAGDDFADVSVRGSSCIRVCEPLSKSVIQLGFALAGGVAF